MAPALLAPSSPMLRQHGLIGASTGYMESQREDWDELAVEAAAVSGLAVELSALSESELPSLLRWFLLDEPELPFYYLSVHGPSKQRRLPEPELVQLLEQLPPTVDAIVMHPDTVEEPRHYLPLGRRLVLENMDMRKHDGRTVEELNRHFRELPDAGFCFDVAHAKSVDPSMAKASAMLGAFASRLRHVHISSLDENSHHVPLTDEDESLFLPLLQRCRDVPWILEAPLA